MENPILYVLFFLSNLFTVLLLIIDARENDRLRTELRIAKRKLDRYKRREVSLGFDTENEE